jgi:hypothetical protein
MQCTIKKVQLRYKQHLTLMIGEMKPNIIERLLLRRKRKAVSFIGSGTVWHRYPELDKVPVWVATHLAEIERRMKVSNKILR